MAKPADKKKSKSKSRKVIDLGKPEFKLEQDDLKKIRMTDREAAIQVAMLKEVLMEELGRDGYSKLTNDQRVFLVYYLNNLSLNVAMAVMKTTILEFSVWKRFNPNFSKALGIVRAQIGESKKYEREDLIHEFSGKDPSVLKFAAEKQDEEFKVKPNEAMKREPVQVQFVVSMPQGASMKPVMSGEKTYFGEVIEDGKRLPDQV